MAIDQTSEAGKKSAEAQRTSGGHPRELEEFLRIWNTPGATPGKYINYPRLGRVSSKEFATNQRFIARMLLVIAICFPLAGIWLVRNRNTSLTVFNIVLLTLFVAASLLASRFLFRSAHRLDRE